MAKVKVPKRFAGIPEPDDGRWIIVIIPNYWGRGPNIDTAIMEIKRSGGRKVGSEPAVVYFADRNAYVDEMGSIQYKQGTKLTKVFEDLKGGG